MVAKRKLAPRTRHAPKPRRTVAREPRRTLPAKSSPKKRRKNETETSKRKLKRIVEAPKRKKKLAKRTAKRATKRASPPPRTVPVKRKPRKVTASSRLKPKPKRAASKPERAAPKPKRAAPKPKPKRATPKPKPKRAAPKPKPKRSAPKVPKKLKVIGWIELARRKKLLAEGEKKLRVPQRNKRGRFVSAAEAETERLHAKLARERKKVEAEAAILSEDRYGITEKHRKQLDRKFKTWAEAVADSNFDLLVERAHSELVGADQWEAAMHISGIPTGEEEHQRQQAQDMLVEALFAALDKVPSMRGLVMGLSLKSDDTLFLIYARKKPIFETRFHRMDVQAERGLLVNKLRQLFGSMNDGRFSVTGMRIMFYYNHSYAKLGDKAVKNARKKNV